MHIPPEWGNFFALVVSFLIFWFIFGRLFFKPYLRLIERREGHLRQLEESAQRLRREEEAALEARRQALAQLERELTARREEARRQAELEAVSTVEQARSAARASLEATARQISSELEGAKAELEQAGQALGRELVDRLVTELRGGTPAQQL